MRTNFTKGNEMSDCGKVCLCIFSTVLLLVGGCERYECVHLQHTERMYELGYEKTLTLFPGRQSTFSAWRKVTEDDDPEVQGED